MPAGSAVYLPAESEVWAAGRAVCWLFDDSATRQGVYPLPGIGGGGSGVDAEMADQDVGGGFEGEVGAAQFVPQQEGGGVEGDDLCHVRLEFALFYDQVFTGDFAYFINVFNLHIRLFFVIISWRKDKHSSLKSENNN